MHAWHALGFHYYHPNKDLKQLVYSSLGRRAAISLLTLFSPIYIYTTSRSLGYDFGLSVIFILLFHLLIFLVKFPVLSLSENISQRLGFKWIIKISAIPFVLFVFTISIAYKYPVFFPISAALWGVHAGFFWWGYHGYFAKSAGKKHFGESIAEVSLLDTIVGVTTPLIGALVITLFGFIYLFALAGFLLLISLLFLGKNHDKYQRRDVKLISVFKLMGEHKSAVLAYTGSSADGLIQSVMWPLFLYLFFGKVVSLGAITSLAVVISSFFALGVGKWFDKQGISKLLALGSPLIFVSWTLRFLMKNVSIFIIADSLWSFSSKMVGLPLHALSYQKARDHGVGAAIMFRELSLMIGDVSSIFLLIFLVFFSNSIDYALVVAGLFSLLPLILAKSMR